MGNKTFTEDFNMLLNKVKTKKHFSLVRFGDGELEIVRNNAIDLSNKFNGEHKFSPALHQKYRIQMIESLTYNDPNYIVGIPCKCCVGESNYLKIKKETKLPESRLTWANILVNANYNRFINEMLPEFNHNNIILISHEKSIISNLPFKVEKHFKVGRNAWIENHALIEELVEFSKSVKDKVFLFAAGTFSNIAIHQCHNVSKDNTYIDIGSTLDVVLGLGKTRRYLKGAPTLKKICIW